MTEVIIFFTITMFFASVIILLFIARKKRYKEDKIISIREQQEYEDSNNNYSQFSNENKVNEDDEGDDIRDIYNKKTPKFKKNGYQTKTYRGTDIEIAGFENPKDLKDLKKDDLNTIDTEDLDREVNKKEAGEINKPVEAPKPDPESIKSGIAGMKAAMEKMNLEVRENYMSGKGASALDNFEHGYKNAKEGGSKEGGKISR